MKRIVSALLGAALWAGAVQAPALAQVLVNNQDSRNFYSPEYAGYVASRGPIPTVVHNDPFGPSADAAVAARIPVPGFLGGASFAAASGSEILAYDRLVMAFDPMPGTSSLHLCRDAQVAPGNATGSRTQVLAVLCRGQHPTSEAALSAPRPGSIDAPAFRELLSQLSLAIFPARKNDAGGFCGRDC